MFMHFVHSHVCETKMPEEMDALTHCLSLTGFGPGASGTDPPGIKLRAAKALEAVDFFVPGYWVFSKMVQSLADIGFDNNDLVSIVSWFVGCHDGCCSRTDCVS